MSLLMLHIKTLCAFICISYVILCLLALVEISVVLLMTVTHNGMFCFRLERQPTRGSNQESDG